MFSPNNCIPTGVGEASQIALKLLSGGWELWCFCTALSCLCW